MPKIVFLFGAGASYGAGSVLPERPPLGNQLYSKLVESYPGSWGQLPEDAKRAFEVENDFERGMQVVFDRYGAAIPELMRQMAVYLVQFRPYARSTLYCRLTEELKAAGLLDRVIYSTLNYDCLLEYSLINAGHGVAYFDEGNENSIPVWKLHGSCNMFSAGVQASQGVQYTTGVTFEGGVKAWLDSNQVILHCLNETGLAPVMCLYMPGKPLNVSPSAIKQLQSLWQKEISQASAIVSIGVRPISEDEHIWGIIGQAAAPLLFVGDDDALKNWCAESGKTNVQSLGNRFSEAFLALVAEVQKYGDR